jgi:hypothetical protein
MMIYVYRIFIYQHHSKEILFPIDWKKNSFSNFYSWPNDYKVGLTKKILLDINVTNTGENAYDTQCLIQLPIGVEYVSSNSSPIVSKRCLKYLLQNNIIFFKRLIFIVI